MKHNCYLQKKKFIEQFYDQCGTYSDGLRLQRAARREKRRPLTVPEAAITAGMSNVSTAYSLLRTYKLNGFKL